MKLFHFLDFFWSPTSAIFVIQQTGKHVIKENNEQIVANYHSVLTSVTLCYGLAFNVMIISVNSTFPPVCFSAH